MSGNDYEEVIRQRFAGTLLGAMPEIAPSSMSRQEFLDRSADILGHGFSRPLGWADGLARPEQIPPQWDWKYFHIDAGRGWGKSRAANEWLVSKAIAEPGNYALIMGGHPYLQTFMDVLRGRLDSHEIDRYGWSAGGECFDVGSSRVYVLNKNSERLRGSRFNATVIDLDTAGLGLYLDRNLWYEIAYASGQIFLHGYDKPVPGWIRNSGDYVFRHGR